MPHDLLRIGETKGWLGKAAADLRGAAVDLQAVPPLLEDALFHCQQAVEKSLKAFLFWHDIPFKKTHDLSELGVRCIEIDPSLEPVCKEAERLTVYAWVFRYPGMPDEADADEAVRSLEIAHEVCGEITKRLPPETTQ